MGMSFIALLVIILFFDYTPDTRMREICNGNISNCTYIKNMSGNQTNAQQVTILSGIPCFFMEDMNGFAANLQSTSMINHDCFMYFTIL
jgi:hypothetical protein